MQTLVKLGLMLGHSTWHLLWSSSISKPLFLRNVHKLFFVITLGKTSSGWGTGTGILLCIIAVAVVYYFMGQDKVMWPQSISYIVTPIPCNLYTLLHKILCMQYRKLQITILWCSFLNTRRMKRKRRNETLLPKLVLVINYIVFISEMWNYTYYALYLCDKRLAYILKSSWVDVE